MRYAETNEIFWAHAPREELQGSIAKFAFSPNMRISSSCLDYLTLKTSEATKLYLTVFDERNTVYFLESFGGLFWKFLAVSRRSTDEQLFAEGEINIVK